MTAPKSRSTAATVCVTLTVTLEDEANSEARALRAVDSALVGALKDHPSVHVEEIVYLATCPASV